VLGAAAPTSWRARAAEAALSAVRRSGAGGSRMAVRISPAFKSFSRCTSRSGATKKSYAAALDLPDGQFVTFAQTLGYPSG